MLDQPDDRRVLTKEAAATVVAADVVNGGVVVRGGCGEVDLHPLWLRERSVTEGAVDPANGQRMVEPAHVARELTVVEASVKGLALHLVFSDGHRSSLSLVSLVDRSTEAPPAPIPWTASEVGVPLIDYRAFAGADHQAAAATRREALSAFFELGFFVLRGTPALAGALHEIASHFGRISSTNFGVLFDVRTEPVPVDLAYTPVALSAHTDQPYRAPTPGIQFLHTIVNDAPGGVSTIVDGLAAINDLASADPDAYDVLCSLPVEFRYDIGTDVKVHRAPIIERHGDGSLRQLRFSPRLDFAPLVDCRTLDTYYRGRRWLAEVLNDPQRQLRYEMRPGDTLVVDNHRVLHGRTSFDPTKGSRHLQGCYIDHDGPITEWILASRNESSR